MRPAALNNMSEAMAAVYGAVTDRILVNLAHYFPMVQPGEEIPGAFQYQARMLAQMGKVNEETVMIIAESLGGYDKALRNALSTAIVEALKDEEPKLRKAAQKGLLLGENAVPPELAPNQMQAFQAYYKQSADKLNLVNTVMLESTQQAYAATVSDVTQRLQRTQGILNAATGEVVTGVSAYNQAVRGAVRRMVDNGLTGFIDHGGHRWSPEAYAAMDIKTTMFNTARAAVWERNEEYGNDLYQVSSHNGARPLCYPWQGKVISRADAVREVEDLDGSKIHVYAQSDTSYGQAAGLFGVNCGHYPMTFIPGFSTVKGEPQDEEENAKTYAESQQQRELERRLREERRDLAVMRAQGAPESEILHQKERIKAADTAIEDFCSDTGRTRRKDREGGPVRTTWPGDKGGDVTRFNGGYIDVNSVPPPKGRMQTLPPATPPPPPPQNVAPQATTTPTTTGIFSKVRGLDDGFKQGMEDALGKTTFDDTKKLYTKYADELVCIDPNTKRAYFKSTAGGVYMNLKNVAAGSNYEEPYEVAFHEFGHMIDWLAGGKNNYNYLSNQEVNGKRLLDVIKSDFRAFKKSLNVSKAEDVIPILKAENMDKKTCGNISDILEKCTGKSYPLGIGHGKKYHNRDGSTEKEFFAEVLDSAVTNKASYDQMTRLFPNAVNMVWDMVRGVI